MENTPLANLVDFNCNVFGRQQPISEHPQYNVWVDLIPNLPSIASNRPMIWKTREVLRSELLALFGAFEYNNFSCLKIIEMLEELDITTLQVAREYSMAIYFTVSGAEKRDAARDALISISADEIDIVDYETNGIWEFFTFRAWWD